MALGSRRLPPFLSECQRGAGAETGSEAAGIAGECAALLCLLCSPPPSPSPLRHPPRLRPLPLTSALHPSPPCLPPPPPSPLQTWGYLSSFHTALSHKYKAARQTANPDIAILKEPLLQFESYRDSYDAARRYLTGGKGHV